MIRDHLNDTPISTTLTDVTTGFADWAMVEVQDDDQMRALFPTSNARKARGAWNASAADEAITLMHNLLGSG